MEGGDDFDTAVNAEHRDTHLNIEQILYKQVRADVEEPTTAPKMTLSYFETFDGLEFGPLAGQNGWSANGTSATVVLAPKWVGNGLASSGSSETPGSADSNKALKIDPPEGKQTEMTKSFPLLLAKRIILEFEVQVNEDAEGHIGALELRPGPAVAAASPLMVRFGSSMELIGSESETSVLVGKMEAERWYRVKLELDLERGTVLIWVDGVLLEQRILTDLEGPQFLSIWGWEAAGAAYLDNLALVSLDQ